MKNYIFSLLFFPFIYLNAQQAPSLGVLDTRNTNNPPIEYKYEIRAEFKQRDIIGVPGNGLYSGMLTIAPWGDNSGNKNHQLNFNDGGIFYRNGYHEDTWGSWSQLIISNPNGNIGLGTNNPQSQLEIYGGGDLALKGASSDAGDIVFQQNTGIQNARIWSLDNGGLYFSGSDNVPDVIFNNNGNVSVSNKLEAREIKVSETPTADFVFEEDYNLPTLQQVEQHIKEKKHLPEIASAKEMEKEGVNIGEFQIKLLQKIEELTLYIIEQDKRIKELEKRK